jgi:hypothetical protein
LSAGELSHLTQFLNDWADDFVRRHAPDLDTKRALGGGAGTPPGGPPHPPPSGVGRQPQ